jgi:hypothetical protein
MGTWWQHIGNKEQTKKTPSHIQPSIIVENPFTMDGVNYLHMVTIKLERYKVRTN